MRSFFDIWLSVNFDALRAGGDARFDFDGSFWDVKFVGKKVNERGVCFAVVSAGAKESREATVFELF